MILLFGPAGAGKSVQGQILAARYGWRWLSTGQLLRDSHDAEVFAYMQRGELVPDEKISEVVGEALKRAKDIDRVIIDGYPRQLSQAKWLIERQPQHERAIKLVIVLEVPQAELLRRLQLRGRQDDTPELIQTRLNQYRQEVYPILSYLSEQGIHIAHVDGTGTVGQVHDRVEEELRACSLV